MFIGLVFMSVIRCRGGAVLDSQLFWRRNQAMLFITESIESN